MLKKILMALVLITAIAVLTACGKQAEQQPQNGAAIELVTPEGETPTDAEKAPEEKAPAEEVKEPEEKAPADTAEPAAQDDAEEAAQAAEQDEDAPAEEEAPAQEEPAAAVAVPELPDNITAPDQMLAEPKQVTVAADGDVLTFREGPGSEYDGFDAVPDGTELTIEAEQDGWGLTNYNDQYGWVSLDFVTE